MWNPGWMKHKLEFRLLGEISITSDMQMIPPLLDFSGGSQSKVSVYNARDLGSISGLGRSPREGNGNPPQYSAWKIPWTEKHGKLQSMGSQRVGHDWVTLLSLFTYCREWRGTKELLDESERGEWKSWLKTQHSEQEYHVMWPHHLMVNRWENSGNIDRLCFLGLQNHSRWWLQPWN